MTDDLPVIDDAFMEKVVEYLKKKGMLPSGARFRVGQGEWHCSVHHRNLVVGEECPFCNGAPYPVEA